MCTVHVHMYRPYSMAGGVAVKPDPTLELAGQGTPLILITARAEERKAMTKVDEGPCARTEYLLWYYLHAACHAWTVTCSQYGHSLAGRLVK